MSATISNGCQTGAGLNTTIIGSEGEFYDHKTKILLGGLGALTPVIAGLLVVDLRVLSVDVTAAAVISYLIRVILLFYLGGLVAFLHRDENSPVKLFELGIAAPALIAGMITGAQREVPKITKPQTVWINSVYAQSPQSTSLWVHF